MLGEITLTLGDFAAIAGLLATIVGVPSMLAAAYLKRHAQDLAAIGRRVGRVEGQVLDLTKEKVDVKAWAREMISTRSKVDAVLRQLAELGGKLDGSVGIAGAIKDLGQQIRQATEAGSNG